MATTNRRNLVLWVRLDGNGDVIPGSEQYRPRGVKPRDGNWRQAIGSYCCSCYCIITFTNNASVGNVLSITTADGAIDWSVELLEGRTKSFVIPSCYDEVFTVTFDTITGDGIAIDVDVLQGTGTITSSLPYLAAGVAGRSVEITTTVPTSKCAEYLVTISND